MQSRYLFSNFSWQGLVIGVGGVVAYWAWWGFPRPDDNAGEGSEYIPTPTSGNGGPTQDPDTNLIPFILGTTASDEQISKIQTVIRHMMQGRRWKPYDHYTERQEGDLDIDNYWQDIRRRYGGDKQGDGETDAGIGMVVWRMGTRPWMSEAPGDSADAKSPLCS